MYEELKTEDIEFKLPLRFRRKEARERICGSRCPLGKCEQTTIEYEQYIYRNDSYMNDRQTRSYEISYRERKDASPLYRTERHYSLREALIEMHELLVKAGIIEPLEEAGK
jgi:hypothetical protein